MSCSLNCSAVVHLQLRFNTIAITLVSSVIQRARVEAGLQACSVIMEQYVLQAVVDVCTVDYYRMSYWAGHHLLSLSV